ncbi:MAG TPA: hypothetical protein VK203_14400 [Nostocaceae cyanobacterium]|nr:hypothetical protein [Kamptonema sp.]HLO86183.1 hypothetical protein [Nostocaceae cyanobacterium]
MRFKTLTIGLITGIMVGCSVTNQNPTINKIGSGEVGEPTVIETKRTAEGTDSPAQSKLSVAEAAKLTPEQVKQLVTKEQNNSKLLDFKIIVPTYIPNGFQVDEFEVKDVTYQGGIGEPDYTGHEYRIVYQNSSNYCFSIEGKFGGFGSGATDYRNVEVSSPALGKVILGYTDFDQVTNEQPFIAFLEGVIMRG